MNYSTIFKISSFVPFLNLMILSLLISHAYFLYGRMPVYGNPDPKTLSFTYELFMISQIILLFSLIFYPYSIFKTIFNKKLSKIILLKYLAVYIIGYIVLMIVFRLEQDELGEWIAD